MLQLNRESATDIDRITFEFMKISMNIIIDYLCQPILGYLMSTYRVKVSYMGIWRVESNSPLFLPFLIKCRKYKISRHRHY